MKFFLLLFIVIQMIELKETSIHNTFVDFFKKLHKKETHTYSNPSYSQRIGNKKQPQSLAILMNFGFDGTSSLHLMDKDTIYWSDNGNCAHGKMYDPLMNVCRDIFCTDGFVLKAKGCVKDESYSNNKSLNSKIKKPLSDELKIELNIFHKLCSKTLSQISNCDNLTIQNVANLSELFKETLANGLNINSSRIGEFQIHSHQFLNKPITNNFNDTLKNISEVLESFKATFKEKKREDAQFYDRYDLFLVSFKLKEKHLFDEELIDPIQLFYNLIALGLDERSFLLPSIDRHFLVKNVVEIRESNYSGWCGEWGDEQSFLADNFNILASFESENNEQQREYFIYVNNTRKMYSQGNFFLTLIYTTNSEKWLIDKDPLDEEEDEEEGEAKNRAAEWNNLNLSDITSIVLGRNSSLIEAKAYLAICDRAPKIRKECSTHSVLKVKQCEFDYNNLSKEFCWKYSSRKCFNVDEYEFDRDEPFGYIRICSIDTNKTISQSSSSFVSSSDGASFLSQQISAWLSFATTSLSLLAMLLTLLTYFLFKDLRNIPGWNVINLTSALFIGQFVFLLGAFVNTMPFVCFLTAIMTHYGFLAAFFWMNIIAFDLYRNFRVASAHVLLFKLNKTERLPFYSIYAWLVPLGVILICVLIDTIVKTGLFYRPCYAGYLSGCGSHTTAPPLKNVIFNQTCQQDLVRTEQFELANIKMCWLLNGTATLIFFGLPVGLIIIVNAALFFLTIYNIKVKSRRDEKLRRFSKPKTDMYAKFFIQMGFIMGFTWSIGFFMATFKNKVYLVIHEILVYLFIVSNGSIGVFIFLMFIFKRDVLNLYKRLFWVKRESVLKMVQRKREAGYERRRKNQIFKISSVDSDVAFAIGAKETNDDLDFKSVE